MLLNFLIAIAAHAAPENFLLRCPYHLNDGTQGTLQSPMVIDTATYSALQIASDIQTSVALEGDADQSTVRTTLGKSKHEFNVFDLLRMLDLFHGPIQFQLEDPVGGMTCVFSRTNV